MQKKVGSPRQPDRKYLGQPMLLELYYCCVQMTYNGGDITLMTTYIT